jgi:hypothetical protein
MTATPPDPIDYQLIGLAEDGGIGDLLAGHDQKQGRVRLQALMDNRLPTPGEDAQRALDRQTRQSLEDLHRHH